MLKNEHMIFASSDARQVMSRLDELSVQGWRLIAFSTDAIPAGESELLAGMRQLQVHQIFTCVMQRQTTVAQPPSKAD